MRNNERAIANAPFNDLPFLVSTKLDQMWEVRISSLSQEMLGALPDPSRERRKLLTTHTKLKKWTEESKQDVHLLLILVRLTTTGSAFLLYDLDQQKAPA